MYDFETPIVAAQRHYFGDTTRPTAVGESATYACATDPDRWTTTGDEGARALCRACPRRWQCAQEACTTPGAEGVWAGILIPPAGRRRQYALRQLRSLAEQNGLTIRRSA